MLERAGEPRNMMRAGGPQGKQDLSMTEPVARLRNGLREIEPRLWRRVDVPLSSTLQALHDII